MSKKPDIFESPKQRLARAKQHIRRLEKRIHSFFKKKPSSRVSETDAKGVTTHALKFHKKLPSSCSDSAAEALEALRSALDQCGYAVAVKSGIANPKNAYFPFGDTVAELESSVKGRCKDLPPEISALFRSFDSHEGGNYALWALNKLCNANKHRLLVPVGIVAQGMKIRNMTLSGPGAIPAPKWDRDKNQIVIAEIGPGGDFKYDIELSLFVSFDEINGVKSGPAVGVLDLMATQVARVLSSTEAECRKIELL